MVGEALAHSVGFRVVARGTVLGTVDEVHYGPSRRWDHPTSLVLRSGNHSVLVPANAVHEVLPNKRLVVLADPVVITSSETPFEADAVQAHGRRRRRTRPKLA